MVRFNRQQLKTATRDEIRLDAADLVTRRLAPTHQIPVQRPRYPEPPAPVPFRMPFVPTAYDWNATTYEGGTGYVREPRTELFVLAAANMVGKDTFYEAANIRNRRYRELVRDLAVSDPEWTVGLLTWLRSEAQLRTASLVGAAEFARARQEAGLSGHTRQVVAAVLRRPDEPGELLAYWTKEFGRTIPTPVKRGIADAVRRLYTPRNLLKYDSDRNAFRFGDVLELTHPTPDPALPWQPALFRYALDLRHRRARAVPPAGDRVLAANRDLLAVPVADRRAVVTEAGGAERLAAAGMTWEALAGWLQGPLDAAAWEAVIPSMGAMALVRNLRNFDRAGISSEAVALVAERIADRDEVIRSRQLPFRFLAAHRHCDRATWGDALEAALTHSLANVPFLPGRTLVLVDRSDSMFTGTEGRTDLTPADAAAIFGTALAHRAEHADLVQFGTRSNVVPVSSGVPILETLARFQNLGGTCTAVAVHRHYQDHDRVVVITDEQAHPADTTLFAAVPEEVPVYTWNLAGYAMAHGAPGPRRYTLGGLSDSAFRVIPLVERGEEARWPWE